MDHGAMKYEDYPYVSGTTQQPEACKVDSSKYAAKVNGWGGVKSSVAEIHQKLKEQPLTMSVASNNDDWFLYKSGILQ